MTKPEPAVRTIAEAGNTVVPAFLALEAAGLQVSALDADLLEAVSAEGRYVADNPLALLGLVKLVELRGWSWEAEDEQIDAVMARFGGSA
jgi:hypothetical protein